MRALTEIAGSTAAVKPFDTGMITNLDVLYQLSDSDDNSGT